MTIECYAFLCPNHSFHAEGPDEGPFCYEQHCQRNAKYIRYILGYQETSIKNAKLIKVSLTPVTFKQKK